ncbi:hypothetical protein CANCADRAFT_57686 [Tortispora caseinolytica NRRL Y-17796]|uniref:GPR1/FUN34/YaaH-class plasma membrane protein n=1 Tax=Tortispora caseinolytica NRRL Y-17796 TaxID=767744 RepID=A0A1E4T9P8_9ASCO|nr:hypothetical protein CANCADRAFT_57686 [Tortispora caseinolytica NRRL Y-17796]
MDQTNASGNKYLDKDVEALRAVNTAGTLPPEIFERLYYQPKPNNDSSLRHKLGVPTGLAILLYTLNFFFMSFVLLGWRNAGADGAAMVGTFPAVGIAGIIVAIFELILGNSFIFTVLMAYGVFFLAFSSTLIPWFGAKAAYSAVGDPIAGGTSEQYIATCAMYFIAWAIISLVLFAGALMVNAVLTVFLFLVFVVFLLLGVGGLYGASGNLGAMSGLTRSAGALAFVDGCIGVYLAFMNVMISVGVSPIHFPVGDLTIYWASKKSGRADIENTM